MFWGYTFSASERFRVIQQLLRSKKINVDEKLITKNALPWTVSYNATFFKFSLAWRLLKLLNDFRGVKLSMKTHGLIALMQVFWQGKHGVHYGTQNTRKHLAVALKITNECVCITLPPLTPCIGNNWCKGK